MLFTKRIAVNVVEIILGIKNTKLSPGIIKKETQFFSTL